MMLGFFSLSILSSVNLASADQPIYGTPHVVDSTTMIIAGNTVQLAHIISLKPGTACRWKNRPLDCGVLASAGLKDLVAGAKVNCVQQSSDQFICTAGGYDLAYGLIHAGWAVPSKGAPRHYFTKRDRAQKHQLGFWAAIAKSGITIAETLSP